MLLTCSAIQKRPEDCACAEQPAVSNVQVVGVAQSFCEVWETVAGTLAELDVLLGFADLAVSAPLPYARPDMLPASEGRVELVGCR